MPFIGWRAQKFNVPSQTFYGDESNTLSGSSTPATPASGKAEVWFDSSAKKWKIIYDNGTIESLGVGLSGAVAHKDTHKSGGSDAFAKTDVLNTASRYLETKSDPSSDSSAFWLVASGSDIKYWDAQGTPVKQTLERRALKGVANGYCELDAGGLIPVARIPTLTDIALVTGTNEFLAAQSFKANVAPLVTLYRNKNAAAAEAGSQFNLDENNASGTRKTFGKIYTWIEDPVNGTEDAGIGLDALIAGANQNIFYANVDGIWFGKDTTKQATFRVANLTTQRDFWLPNVSSYMSVTPFISNVANDINNTAAEQNMMNVTIPANSLLANGMIRFRISGYLLQNQATGTTYTFTVKFGGTTLWTDTTASVAQSATKLPFIIEGIMYNKNATNAQGMSGRLVINDTTASTTGIGDIGDDEVLIAANFDSEGADTTKDTTSSQAFVVSVTMSVANTATHTVVKQQLLEMVAAP